MKSITHVSVHRLPIVPLRMAACFAGLILLAGCSQSEST